jgi:hypothetical protein
LTEEILLLLDVACEVVCLLFDRDKLFSEAVEQNPLEVDVDVGGVEGALAGHLHERDFFGALVVQRSLESALR